ncbi:MAG: hypothetical protein DIU60_017045 [Actinomycetes bacterium]
MTDSRVQVIQRICERLAGDGGAVRLDMVDGHPRLHMDQRLAQQQARRELTLLGWKVIEGREHTLTVMGWSRENLAYRLRTLLLACGMLRHERQHTVHVAIACAERHLEAGHPTTLDDVLEAARNEVARELRWPARLDDVGELDRRAHDPAIAAQLDHIRRLEAEVRHLCDQHLAAARTAVEVFWKCRRFAHMSSETARQVAVQEALRPHLGPELDALPAPPPLAGHAAGGHDGDRGIGHAALRGSAGRGAGRARRERP